MIIPKGAKSWLHLTLLSQGRVSFQRSVYQHLLCRTWSEFHQVALQQGSFLGLSLLPFLRSVSLLPGSSSENSPLSLLIASSDVRLIL